MKRKYPLVNDEVYHIFSRTIADFKVFNSDKDYSRMMMLLAFFQIEEPPAKFSIFMELKSAQQFGFYNYFGSLAKDQPKIVEIIAYCLMPTHIHLVLKQLKKDGISTYIRNALNGYSRYFNIHHRRKGPLWEARFKNVLVENDEQLLHLTRYVHLNPVTADLVKKPENWLYSSYLEYLNDEKQRQFCFYDDLLKITPKVYKKFVEERIDYQKELGKIKNLCLD